MVLFEIVDQEITKIIRAHAPEHGDGCPQTCRSNSLIRAFASGDHLQITAANGLAGLREARCTHDKVGVQ